MNSQPQKADILLLLDRPGEPVDFPKGDNNSTCYFDVPPNFLPNRYRTKAVSLLNRFNDDDGGRRIDIGSLTKDHLMNISLGVVEQVKRRDIFSLFIPLHRKAACHLINILMDLQDFNDLLVSATYIRDRVNPQLFVYVLSTVIVHHPATKSLTLPIYSEIFPEKFICSEAISEAKENANVFSSSEDRVPIEIPRDYTGNDGDEEHRLAYFREDIGVNLHHWHWHLIYPIGGTKEMIDKDRRGELFYYMHHQILARYNVERLCNSLNLVSRLLDWNRPIEEAYYPMISTDVSGKAWSGRPPNMRLSNINRPDQQLSFDIEDMMRWKDRIYEAIHRKKVLRSDGTEIDIDNESGIDILGNMIESSALTTNRDYYGDLHNTGHNALAYIHDPHYKYMLTFNFKQTPCVMSETGTAMRDPVFYRWHAFVDDLFNEHKNLLPPYDEKTLNFPGVQVTKVQLCSYNSENVCSQINVLNTYFMKSDVNLSRGLDYTPRGSIIGRITHLNHDRFSYTINVNNTTSTRQMGTVRIFIAPTLGFSNFPIKLAQQKKLMIEMDRFVAILCLVQPGANTIQRESIHSSLTIPFDQTFRNLDENRPQDTHYGGMNAFNYCGCGWPQHMLVPKGTTSGYPMELFVMISNYNLDRVENQQNEKGCRTGVAFCGLRDRKYPDKKPMGFPFDRRIRDDVNSFTDFMTPNMARTSIKVIHSEAVNDENISNKPAIPVGQLLAPHSRFSEINEIGQ